MPQKISFLLVIPLLLVVTDVLAQQLPDSIRAHLDSLDDEGQISALYSYGMDLEMGHPESAKDLYLAGLKTAIVTNNTQRTMSGLQNMAYLYLYGFGNGDSALIFVDSAMVFAKQHADPLPSLMKLHGSKAEFLRSMDRPLSAAISCEKAGEIALALGDSSRYIDYLLEGAYALSLGGDLDEAINRVQLGMELASARNNLSSLFYAYYTLTVIYSFHERYDEAVKYGEDAMRVLPDSILFETPSFEIAYAIALKNVGEFSEAEQIYQRLLKQSYHSESMRVTLKINLSQVFLAAFNIDSALHYADEVKAHVTQTRDVQIVADWNGLMAKISLKKGNSGLARDYAMKAINTLKNNLGYTHILYDTYKTLIESYRLEAQYREALETYTTYISLKDSLDRKRKEERALDLDARYELRKKESEITRLAQKAEIETLKTESANQWTIVLAIGLLLALILFALAAFGFRKYRALSLTLKKNNLIIQNQADQLRENDELKSRFFANISHELRTPLTLLLGTTDAIIKERKYAATEVIKEKLAKSKQSITQLKNMIDDILDLSKLEVDALQLEKRSIRIKPFYDRVVSAFESYAEYRQVDFSFTNDLDLDDVGEIDDDQMEKVINNLMFNALKFTPKGYAIDATLEYQEDQLRFEVRNTGSYISKEELDKIFDRFYQTPQEHQLSRGTGLGLAIAKEITELHGGQLSVESNEQFTQFSVVLPMDIRKEQAEEMKPKMNIPPIVSDQKGKVLIVEDNQEMAAYLSEIFSEAFEIQHASNGKEALEKLAVDQPDLLITDLMMPVVDGFSLVAQVRNNPTLAQLPIIMLTATAGEEERVKGFNIGIDDYIVKPFNTDELLARVNNLLENTLIRTGLKPQDKDADRWVLQNKELQDWMGKAIAFVKANIDNGELSVKMLAEEMAVSERTLFRKVEEAVGMKPAKLIREVRLRHALSLLQQGKVNTLSQLAAAVGFENQTHFAKLFQQRFGKIVQDFLK